jgi:hypothetical protein
MNDKTIDLLNKLADKFGTTAEHLWGVLVKQAPIQASIEIAFAVLAAGAWVSLVVLVTQKTTPPERKPDARWGESAEWTDEGAFMAWVAVGVFALVVLLLGYFAVSTGITAIKNPEYWALKQLLPNQ